jgi:hypothetical protein
MVWLRISTGFILLFQMVFSLQSATLTTSGYWEDSDSLSTSTLPGHNAFYTFNVTGKGNQTVTIKLSTTTADLYVRIILLDAANTVIDNAVLDNSGGHTNRLDKMYTVNVASSPQTFKIVAATWLPHNAGQFSLSVIGNVTAPALSFVTAPRIITDSGGRTGSNTVGQRRACLMYANACLATGLKYKWLKTGTGVSDSCYYPIFSAKSKDQAAYACSISVGEKSVVRNVTLRVNPLLHSNIWRQSDFVIGAHWGPFLDGVHTSDDIARLKTCLDANINLVVGYGDGYDYYLNHVWGVSNGYILDRSVDLRTKYPAAGRLNWLILANGVSMKAVSYNIVNINSALRDYYSNSPPARRSVFSGYVICDEPYWDNTAINLIKQEGMAFGDQTRLSFFNLLPFNDWNFSGWTDYQKYISNVADNASTRVLCYDYYIFDKSRPNGYHSFNNPPANPTIYRNLDSLACAVKTRNNTYSDKVNFWAYALSSAHTSCSYNYVQPTEMLMRYSAFSPLLYGAKGIIWYTYEKPDGISYFSPTDSLVVNHATYDVLKNVNSELRRMGPTLMKLTWEITVHGAATDPNSSEPTLPGFNPANPPAPLKDITAGCTGCGWSRNALAIGIHNDGKWKYLTILNKAVTYNRAAGTYSGTSNTSTYVVSGSVYPRVFDKTSGGWKLSASRVYNSRANATSFTLAIDGGDMQLVWLGPADITPALK